METIGPGDNYSRILNSFSSFKPHIKVLPNNVEFLVANNIL